MSDPISNPPQFSPLRDLKQSISDISTQMKGHSLSQRTQLPPLDQKIHELFSSVQLMMKDKNLLSKNEVNELKELMGRVTLELPKTTFSPKYGAVLKSIKANIQDLTLLLDKKETSSCEEPHLLENTLYVKLLIKEGKEEEALSFIQKNPNSAEKAVGYAALLQVGGMISGLVLKDIANMAPSDLTSLKKELDLDSKNNNTQTALSQIPGCLFEKQGIHVAVEFLNSIEDPVIKLLAYTQLKRAPGVDEAIKNIPNELTKKGLQDLSNQRSDQQLAKDLGRLRINLHSLTETLSLTPEVLNKWMQDYSALINEHPERASPDDVKTWIECCERTKVPLGKETFFGLASVPLHVQIAMINHCDTSKLVQTFPEMRSNYENDVPDKEPTKIVRALNRDFARCVSGVEIRFNKEELDTSKASKDKSSNELTESIKELNNAITRLNSIETQLNNNIIDTKKALDTTSSLPESFKVKINTLLSNLAKFNPDETIQENISILSADFNLDGFDIKKTDEENAEIIIKNNDLKGLSKEEKDNIENLARELKNLKTGTEAPLRNLRSLEPTTRITESIQKLLAEKLNLIRNFKERLDRNTKTISTQDTLINLENETLQDIQKSSSNSPELDPKSTDTTELRREKEKAIAILEPYGLALRRTGEGCEPLTDTNNFDNAIELTKEVISLHKKAAPLASKDETLELLHTIKLTTSSKGMNTLQKQFPKGLDGYAIRLKESSTTTLDITATDTSLTSENTFHFDILNNDTGDVIPCENKIFFDAKKRLCAVHLSLE